MASSPRTSEKTKKWIDAAGKLTHDMLLTDPVQAKDFVAKTGVERWPRVSKTEVAARIAQRIAQDLT